MIRIFLTLSSSALVSLMYTLLSFRRTVAAKGEGLVHAGRIPHILIIFPFRHPE
jgi:hypothetical protein